MLHYYLLLTYIQQKQALCITKLRQSTNIPPDSAVAILLSSGLALGIVLVSLSGRFSVDLFSFLFGSILLVSVEDTLTILILAAAVLAFVVILYKRFLYITFDEKQAKIFLRRTGNGNKLEEEI
jgi:zinc transport system permease protein